MRIIALMVNVYNNLSLANLFEICSIQLICARQGKTFFRLLQSRRSSSYCFLRFILIIFVCLCGFIGRSIHFERENVGPRHPSNWKSFAFSLSILISLFCWSFSVYKRRNVECVANESKLIFFCFSSSSLFFFWVQRKNVFFFFFLHDERNWWFTAVFLNSRQWWMVSLVGLYALWILTMPCFEGKIIRGNNGGNKIMKRGEMMNWIYSPSTSFL